MNTVCIGWDKSQSLAFHTLAHSIITRASKPIQIVPIIRSALPFYTRPRGVLDSTDFSISRFLSPLLCNYRGTCLFMDCDIVVKDDITKLFDCFNDQYSVQVVKHEYFPREQIKMNNAVQTRYIFKNWTSVMLFNNQKCKALTADYVNTAPGLDLHQFKWLESIDEIGALPEEWNHLVGYSVAEKPISAYHFTSGGPWLPNYEQCEHHQQWDEEYIDMTAGSTRAPFLETEPG